MGLHNFNGPSSIVPSMHYTKPAKVTITLDAEVKFQAQNMAADVGLSLSKLIEFKLREFIKEQRLHLELYPLAQHVTANTYLPPKPTPTPLPSPNSNNYDEACCNVFTK